MTATEDGIGTVSSVPSGSPVGQVNLSSPDRGHHLHDSRAGWQTDRKASAAPAQADSFSSDQFVQNEYISLTGWKVLFYNKTIKIILMTKRCTDLIN